MRGFLWLEIEVRSLGNTYLQGCFSPGPENVSRSQSANSDFIFVEKALELSVNGGDPAAKGTLRDKDLSQEVDLDPQRGRFVLLRVLVDDPKQRVSVAELDLFTTGATPIVSIAGERFAKRNSSVAVSVLGLGFLKILYHELMDLYINGLRSRPEYLKIVEAYPKGDSEKGLIAFRDYHIGKLRDPRPMV